MNRICIDIGGTAIKYGVIDDTLQFSYEDQRPTQAMLGGQHVVENVIEIVHALQEKTTAVSVCISTTGIIDPVKGIILEANPALMPSYTGIHIAEAVTEKTGLPCYVENDVNCAALAEYHHGAAKGAASSLTLTVGTGIGGAFILNGNLLSGHSFSACEVGYMHIENGISYEELAATSVLVKRVAQHYPQYQSEINGIWIFDRAINQQDAICISEIQRMCHYLALGIANLCYTLNPEVVVIGGGIAHQKDYLMPIINKELSEALIAPVYSATGLRFAGNLNNAGMLGAYINCMNRSSIS